MRPFGMNLIASAKLLGHLRSRLHSAEQEYREPEHGLPHAGLAYCTYPLLVGPLSQLSRSGRRKIGRHGAQRAAPIACRTA